MCEIKFHVKLPIFVARQWIRHRTASVNEYSGRYSVIDNEFYIPAAEAVAAQSSSNRQGRDAPLGGAHAHTIAQMIRRDAEASYRGYIELLGESPDHPDHSSPPPGVARELARIGLGVNFYTQWYWKIDLHNFMNFLRLRADKHAQYEIRQYANVMLEIMKKWVPVTYQAFLDYRLNAFQLSAVGRKVIKRMLEGEKVVFENSGLTRREWVELIAEFGNRPSE
jgi:thymidylate synthase (FAD)